jgi:predicted acyl esterase
MRLADVPLHLPHTFTAYDRLTNSKHVQVAMMGAHGLAWPWESLHIEALAWFDHWLKEQDTGILDGPPFRYILPETEGWRTTDAWPIPEAVHHAYALRVDGGMGEDEGQAGSRTYMNLGGGLNRPRASETDPPALLHWTTPPLPHDLDLIGPIELQLDAACTAPDTAFIAVLQDVDENENAINITAGYLRASLRAVDESASKPGAPVLPCRNFDAVPIGKKVSYRIPLVPNARRFRVGHKLRLYITTDDQNPDKPALLEFRHASIGTSSFDTIFSSSRLLLPVLG